jgi:hypothetical protein
MSVNPSQSAARVCAGLDWARQTAGSAVATHATGAGAKPMLRMRATCSM